MMMYSMLIHNIGKNPDVMRGVGLDPAMGSHDEAVRRLFSPEYEEQQQKFLPTFADSRIFTDRQKKTIADVLRLPFNLPGFVLSHRSPDEIRTIESVDAQTLAIHAWHGILDIAGTHVDNNHPESSLILNEPTARRLLDALDVLTEPPE